MAKIQEVCVSSVQGKPPAPVCKKKKTPVVLRKSTLRTEGGRGEGGGGVIFGGGVRLSSPNLDPISDQYM